MVFSISRTPYNGAFPWLSRQCLQSIVLLSRYSYQTRRAGFCDTARRPRKEQLSWQGYAASISTTYESNRKKKRSWMQSRLKVVKKELGSTFSVVPEYQRTRDSISPLVFNLCSKCLVSFYDVLAERRTCTKACKESTSSPTTPQLFFKQASA